MHLKLSLSSICHVPSVFYLFIFFVVELNSYLQLSVDFVVLFAELFL